MSQELVATSRRHAAPAAPGVPHEVELSVIVPTFDERDNVGPLVARLDACLAGIAWEVIFVDDDSPDGTAAVVRELGARDRRVRCIQRLGRRGLASACIEGMLASAAPYLAVMDADLQHDESLLPAMLATLEQGDVDIVIGSRHVAGGGLGSWDGGRATLSRLATRLSRLILPAELRDPMSGFFMLRREAFEAAVPRLSGIGFKILLDLFASAPRPLRFKELPYEFRPRAAGRSKLDQHAAWDYAMLLLDKLVGTWVPVRLVAFALVGGVGIGVHLSVLALLFAALGLGFVASQTVATLVAMTSNFALNNLLTYRDRRLVGWQWLRGWASFTLACGIGVLANVGVAAWLFRAMDTFWLVSALAGIVVGLVWNYAVTSVYTWRVPFSDQTRRS